MTTPSHDERSSPPRSYDGQDREKVLRERLLKAREEGERPSGSGQSRRRSPSPADDHRDSRSRGYDRYTRRPSPSYESYRGAQFEPPGPPPRREEYERYPASRESDYRHRPSSPHWGRPPPPPNGAAYYGDSREERTYQHHPDQNYGVPPPGVWGRRGHRDHGGGERAEGSPQARPGPGGAWHGDTTGTGDFFSSRNEQRKLSTLSIWPPSPKSPYRSDSEDGGKKSKKSKSKQSSSRSKHGRSSRHHHRHQSGRKRHHDDSDGDTDSEEEAYRRRKRKEHDRRRDHANSKDRDRRSRHRSSRSQGRQDSDVDERSEKSGHDTRSRSKSEVDHSRSKDRHHRHRRRGSLSSSSSSRSSDEGGSQRRPTVTSRPDGLQVGQSENPQDDGSEEEIGPQLPLTADGKRLDPRAYGGALLPGEGSAMAAFLQDGKRIPRRGEIGLSSEQIEDYEKAGYVMSGSRHARMNAVRMRKENQVISAEEKRTLLKMRNEEMEKKEREIVGQFKEMLDTMQPGGH